ncbi:uncharacterized protein LOC124699120 isoform X1 [Lolium rigidum]|uniref:uncharacterized protein LOC124699120 isoform X1 n=1 Tax=Lolium rigidum TaxID=89674 RepID=UPI001F5CC2D1|nr:uncharacterized protein LOC124699120 isoform X1 [Lolium rigidum]
MGKLAILAAVERLPRARHRCRQQGSLDLVHESMELSGQMTEQQLNGSSNICCDGTKISSSSDKCQQRPTLPSKPQPAANTQRTNASSKTAAGNKKPGKRSICHEVRQGVPEAYDRHGGRSACSGAGAPQRNDQEIPAPHRASATRETSPSQEVLAQGAVKNLVEHFSLILDNQIGDELNLSGSWHWIHISFCAESSKSGRRE